MNFQPALLAIAGGFMPALIWLYFWLKEDEFPEPRHLLLIAFIGGMLAIPVALSLELLWHTIAGVLIPAAGFAVLNGFSLIVGFAFIEELVKYMITRALIFWRKDFDEPVDAMVYLVTAALGFAAIENVMYLKDPFGLGILSGLEVTNLRFLGATLLHALSSAILGLFVAGSFFRNTLRKEIALAIGLVVATALHAFFNLLILVTDGVRIEPALVLLVIVSLFILFAFEQIKHRIKTYYA